MTTTLRAVFVLLFILVSTSVNAAPASEESIRQLLEVTKERRRLDDVRNQMIEKVRQKVQQVFHGQLPTLEQQAIAAKMENNIVAMVEDEFSWEKQEPRAIFMYQETFTEEEIAGVLSFYKTPAGQAVINKMPTLTQQFMLQMSNQMESIKGRMKEIQDEAIAEFKKAGR
jgi:hypothetical protein